MELDDIERLFEHVEENKDDEDVMLLIARFYNKYKRYPRNHLGQTLLHQAIHHNRWRIALYFVENDIQIEIETNQGNNFLHFLTRPLQNPIDKEYEKLIRILEQKNISWLIERRNCAGYTPFNHLMELGVFKETKMLVKMFLLQRVPFPSREIYTGFRMLEYKRRIEIFTILGYTWVYPTISSFRMLGKDLIRYRLYKCFP